MKAYDQIKTRPYSRPRAYLTTFASRSIYSLQFDYKGEKKSFFVENGRRCIVFGSIGVLDLAIPF